MYHPVSGSYECDDAVKGVGRGSWGCGELEDDVSGDDRVKGTRDVRRDFCSLEQRSVYSGLDENGVCRVDVS